MTQWQPLNADGTLWGTEHSYLFLEDGLWKASVGGMTVVVRPTMREAAREVEDIEKRLVQIAITW